MFNESEFFDVGGGLVIATGHLLDAPAIAWLVQGVDAGSLVETELALPVDARIERAQFTVRAAAVPKASITSIATVRGANKQSFSAESAATIDFGRMLTVGDLYAFGASVSTVLRWNGAAWQALPNGDAFPETVTDRLLVETDVAGVSQDALLEALSEGSVSLPSVPGGLELQIDGTTVWFDRQGSTAGMPEVTVGDSEVGYAIDRTDALRQAFAAARDESGLKKVKVTLRTSGAGKLTLTPSVTSLRVHTHQFPPDGLVRTFDLVEEGLVTIDVSPPNASDVRELAALVRGSFGPERVQPPLGPIITADATLVLAPGRVLLLGLPTSLTVGFAELTGVRVNVTASAGGGELTGRLLTDVDDQPGAVFDASDITPLPIAPSSTGWRTLRFTEPVKLPPAPPAPGPNPPPDLTGAWLELQTTYGELDLGVTTLADAAPATAPIRRRLPGGGTATVTVIPELHELQSAVRLVGIPDRDRPIPAVTFGIEPATAVIGVTPTADNISARLTLEAPLPAADGINLTAIVAAAGSLTLDTIEVTYKENE